KRTNMKLWNMGDEIKSIIKEKASEQEGNNEPLEKSACVIKEGREVSAAPVCVAAGTVIYALVVFAFSMFCGITYVLQVEEKNQQQDVHFIIWGTMTYAFVFIMILQLICTLVYFESTACFGRFIFTVFFVSSFILCIAVLIGTIYCRVSCPWGKREARQFYGSQNAPIPSWLITVIDRIDWLRIAAIISCLFFVLSLHIYLVYVLRFLEEKEIREYKAKQAEENPTGAKRTWPENLPEPSRRSSSLYDVYFMGV
ncbi:hypothetical protein Ocin01_03238, partial [Orchesella cincta]